MPTKVHQQGQKLHSLGIKTLQRLRLSLCAVMHPQLPLKLLQIIAFNHHYQLALKRTHPHADIDYQKTRISDYRPRQCSLQKVQVLLRSRKNCGRKRHTSIDIGPPSLQSSPGT